MSAVAVDNDESGEENDVLPELPLSIYPRHLLSALSSGHQSATSQDSEAVVMPMYSLRSAPADLVIHAE